MVSDAIFERAHFFLSIASFVCYLFQLLFVSATSPWVLHDPPIALQRFWMVGPLLLAHLLLSYWRRSPHSLIVIEIEALIASVGILGHAIFTCRSMLEVPIRGGSFVALIIVLQSLCLYLRKLIPPKSLNITHREPTERDGSASARILERFSFYLSVSTLACYAVPSSYLVFWLYMTCLEGDYTAAVGTAISVTLLLVQSACCIPQVCYSGRIPAPRIIVGLGVISLATGTMVAGWAFYVLGPLSAVVMGLDFLLFSFCLQIAWLWIHTTINCI